jgi:hypothetical protein
MTYKESLPPHIKAIIELAQLNRQQARRAEEEGKSPSEIIAKFMNNPAVQVVVGIWPDETQSNGFGWRVIKGDVPIERLFLGGIPFDAVFCDSAEQAEVLRLTLGEDRGELH